MISIMIFRRISYIIIQGIISSSRHQKSGHFPGIYFELIIILLIMIILLYDIILLFFNFDISFIVVCKKEDMTDIIILIYHL